MLNPGMALMVQNAFARAVGMKDDRFPRAQNKNGKQRDAEDVFQHAAAIAEPLKTGNFHVVQEITAQQVGTSLHDVPTFAHLIMPMHECQSRESKQNAFGSRLRV